MSHARLGLAAIALFAMPGIPTCNVYHADVERICDAEQRSGIDAKKDPAGVQSWLEHSIASGQGVVLLNQLQAEGLRDRASQLRGEARAQSIAACPLADAYEALANDQDYKDAVKSLCSGEAMNGTGSVAHIDVTDADDNERMREITDWALTNLKSPPVQQLVAKMAQAPVKERSGILKAEAGKFGITSCLLATELDRPAPPPPSVSFVSLPSFSFGTLDAPPKMQRLLLDAISTASFGQVINNCYGAALVKSPNLSGTVNLRLAVDGKGKVSKVEDGGSNFSNGGVIKCLVNNLTGVTLLSLLSDKGSPPAFKFGVPISLTPERGIPPQGWPNVMPTVPGYGPPTTAGDAGAPASPVDAGAPDAGKKKKGR